MSTRRSFLGQVIGLIAGAPLIAEQVKINYDKVSLVERILKTMRLEDEQLLKMKLVLTSFEEDFACLKINRVERTDGGFKLHIPDIKIMQPIEINGCKLIDPNGWFVDQNMRPDWTIYAVPGDTVKYYMEMKLEVR